MIIQLARRLLICCCSLAFVNAQIYPELRFMSGLYDINKGFSGSCQSETSSSDIEIHVTNSSVSCQAATKPTYGDERSKLDASLIQAFPRNKTLVFNIREPALQVYNMWCRSAKTVRCKLAATAELTVAEAADGSLHCNLTFADYLSETGLQKVEWLLNGAAVEGSEAKALTMDDYTSYSPDLWFFAFPLPTIAGPGKYECRFTQKDTMVPPLSASLEINKKPEGSVMQISPAKEQYIDQNQVTLSCSFLGFPVPDISWSLNGVTLEDADTNKAVSGALTQSYLNIESLEDSKHKGLYSCFANNSYGNASLEITLHVRDKLAPVWPFLGIVLQVLILAVCIAVGEKQRKKKINEKKARLQETLEK